MLFLEFRPITRGRLRRSRVSFWLLTLAALALYAATALDYAFPGASATWIAWAAGLDVREVPSHPLLMWAAGHVVRLPWLSLPLRLNLMAAVAGALAVGWTFKVVWFVVFEAMREESAVTHASRNARFAGWVAALAVGLSLPVWQAATRFQPQIFDVALLMACAHLLTVYARSKRTVWLLFFGLLYGAGMAESPLFLVALPVMAVFAVVVEWKLEWCRVGRLFGTAVLAALALAGVHAFAARQFVLSRGLEVTLQAMLHVTVSVLREQAQAIGQMFPEHLWFPVFVLGLGSAALSFFAALRSLDNRRSWSAFILSLVLTIFALLLLFNVPFGPWGVVAKAGVVPAATYLIAGVGIALLTASWRALALLDDPVDVEIPFDKEDDDEPPLPHPLARSTTILFNAGRGVGLMAMPILVVAILVAGVLNVRWLVADNGAFADRAADEVLDGLGQRDWVVANGIIDANLLIRARERGQTVHLLCPYRARETHYTDAVRRTFTADTRFSERARLRAESLLAYSFHLFIDDLFSADTAMADKAICMGLPDLWHGAGLVPVPDRLFYGAASRTEDIAADKLLESHRAFWTRWQPFVEWGEGKPRQLGYRYRVALLRHMAFVANNAGVTLDDLKQPEAAFEAYLKAREIYPDNISALLNLFDAVARGMHPEMKETIERQLRDKVEHGRDRYPLWSLSRHYGYVRNVELFVRMGWQWALSSSPGSVLAGLRGAYAMQQDEQKRAALSAMMASLYEMRGDFKQSAAEYKKALERDPKNTFAISGLARLALQRSIVDEARAILENGEKAGAPRRQLRQDWAALYLVSGDLSRARVLLQEMAEEPDATPMTLAMLAMAMIEQDDIGAVETKVLPRLTKISKDQDGYFTQVIQGRVWQSKGKQGLKNARLCFQRAALIRPDVQALLDVLLTLDVSLEDRRTAEARALTILRQRPEHPYANFIMGTIRLEQGQYGDAEGYLRRSVADEKPMLAALNNFAEVLCRIRKLDEAEKVARQATELAPERYEGWATLAHVLAEKNLPDPATEALAKARQINADDARLNVVDALIAVKRGNPDAADQALARAGELSALSVAEQHTVTAVREAIARLRRTRE